METAVNSAVSYGNTTHTAKVFFSFAEMDVLCNNKPGANKKRTVSCSVPCSGRKWSGNTAQCTQFICLTMCVWIVAFKSVLDAWVRDQTDTKPFHLVAQVFSVWFSWESLVKVCPFTRLWPLLAKCPKQADYKASARVLCRKLGLRQEPKNQFEWCEDACRSIHLICHFLPTVDVPELSVAMCCLPVCVQGWISLPTGHVTPGSVHNLFSHISCVVGYFPDFFWCFVSSWSVLHCSPWTWWAPSFFF